MSGFISGIVGKNQCPGLSVPIILHYPWARAALRSHRLPAGPVVTSRPVGLRGGGRSGTRTHHTCGYCSGN